MSTVYLVWNADRSECVGFTDIRDAEQAAGIRQAGRGTGGGVSTLSEFFRSNFADEDIWEEPEQVFEIQEIEV